MIATISFLFVIAVLIIAHEFGHFIVSKKLGVPVDIFSIGFGPKLFSKKIGETEYRVSAVPLGGYVKIGGMDEDHDRPDGYYSKPRWQRFLIIAAGPIFNLFLALILFMGINLVEGIPTGKPTNAVDVVLAGSPAQRIGLMADDVIIDLNGKPVRDGETMVKIIHAHPGKVLQVKVRRGKSVLKFKVKPKPTMLQGKRVGLIGFYPKSEMKKVGVLQSVGLGLQTTYIMTKTFLLFVPQAIVRMIRREKGGPQLVGPVGIARMAGQRAKRGFFSLLLFIATISVNLGILNLFPFPALDGGHLLFLGAETIRGKRLDPSKENMIHMVGFALLLLLMAVVVVQDLVRGTPITPHMP